MVGASVREARGCSGRQGTCVNDFAAADRSQFCGGERRDGDGLTVQSYEFHFEARAVPVYMHYRADIACLETVCREIHGQHYAVEFLDRVFSSGSG